MDLEAAMAFVVRAEAGRVAIVTAGEAVLLDFAMPWEVGVLAFRNRICR